MELFCALFLVRQQKFSFRKTSIFPLDASRTIYKPQSYRSRISSESSLATWILGGGKNSFLEDIFPLLEKPKNQFDDARSANDFSSTGHGVEREISKVSRDWFSG